MLKSICELNDFLVQNEKGFVKVAVSFAALSIDELEQGTLSYRERLELLAELSRLGLPTSVTLKPVLPFVSNEEYNDILKDCAKLVKRITIGGLYVNRNTAFFKKYIDGKYQTKPRRVSWLSGQPLWDYVCQEEKLLSIANSAVEKGLLVFESDEELIKSFVNSEGGSEHE